MKTIALRGNVVTDYEVWTGGTVLLEGSRVKDVSREPLAADEVREYDDHFLCPGFVDLQVNGSFGVDIATEPGRVPELSRGLTATGVTSYLPTLISAPRDLYHETLPKLADLARESIPGGAEVLGVHLEGPFINSERRGAHPAAHIVSADPGLLDELLDLGPVRMLTLAPELEGAAQLTNSAGGRGAAVSAGHSDATFDLARAAFGEVAGVTHLFNAMSPLHHREPGIPGAAFAHPHVTCGIIADGWHVHPEMVALAFRALGPDRLYLTTDAIAAAGMGPGEYSLATRRVYLDGGVPRLEDGTIAGSILTMDEALKNILAFTGCTLPEAVRMAAATPARLVGEGKSKGRLVPGYDADITVLRSDLSIEAVYKGGSRIYSAGNLYAGTPRLGTSPQARGLPRRRASSRPEDVSYQHPGNSKHHDRYFKVDERQDPCREEGRQADD
ncbi:MAG: N-acetylglucosamine-6-phosphate deacetylase [uncultured Rubrobacteraceae bacterium]|uniref:N-acetylglucosamine-6-phosphate deacetylase n=1 Tax=uncultured Rubrobacteraceae bacterium TaxID=349277 RepID=A0A6J4QJ77_9ACTN|nr:MAG: N-acetylglucosamine-6-phosphate deacetylase [uncultured Rubrobacteraceae bacterium]